MVKQQILLIDHNDSFTYNLVHLFKETGLCNIEVVNFQKITLKQINTFDKIVLGPGPGLPQEYPHFNQILENFATTKNILGICLGHQAIGQFFEAKLIHLPQVLHGQKAQIHFNTTTAPLFKDIQNPFEAGLYHSWILDASTLPENLIPQARTTDNLLMAFSHKHYNIYGLQFHPESCMTPEGKKIIANWILI
ncbi:MAG: aminodeoxychorismate/anthranilate synthase component II [Bacteroidales bacterium]|nr:aminodeoxychorismate/anthranilate synthase component II [Bacteroidales bacterium]